LDLIIFTKKNTMKLQIALITHADNELGIAISKACAEREMKLLIVGEDKELLYSLDEEIQELGGSAIALVADLHKFEEAKKLHQIATVNYGQLDMVLHLPYSKMPFQPHLAWETYNRHISELLPLCNRLNEQTESTIIFLNFINQSENKLFQAIRENIQDGLNNLRKAFPSIDILNIEVEIEMFTKKNIEKLLEAIFYIVEAPESIRVENFKINLK